MAPQSQNISACVIVWFRQDLRLGDNPALYWAASTKLPILPLYVLDKTNPWQIGAASKWWLHHSLLRLNKKLNGAFCFQEEKAQKVFQNLVKQYNIRAVYWNTCYHPWQDRQDKTIQDWLQKQNIEVHTFNGKLLFEPLQNLKKDDTPYKVFTPFYNNLQHQIPTEIRLPFSSVGSLDIFQEAKTDIKQLNLLDTHPWHKKLSKYHNPGEENANQTLQSFIENNLETYIDQRDYFAQNSTSSLSAHLCFGEISVHTIIAIIAKMQTHQQQTQFNQAQLNQATTGFIRQLIWREFAYYLLYHYPTLPEENWNKKFDAFPYIQNQEHLNAWAKGQTGIPLVDAGMRQLWETGIIHNRVRMVVSSFLVKNLLISWQEGARWFWDTLVDADLANNSFGWQWIAGCGTDAAPYFRIFSPIRQGEKFDTEGKYVRYFVPELASLPSKYIYQPWEAPPLVLEEAKVANSHYPKPIIDLSYSRQRALNAVQVI